MLCEWSNVHAIVVAWSGLQVRCTFFVRRFQHSGFVPGVQADERRAASAVHEPMGGSRALLATRDLGDGPAVVRRVARNDLTDVTAPDCDAVTHFRRRNVVGSRRRIAAGRVVENDEPDHREGQNGTEKCQQRKNSCRSIGFRSRPDLA